MTVWNGQDISKGKEHDHDPLNDIEIRCLRAADELKKACEINSESVPKQYSLCLAKLTAEGIKRISIKKTIYEKRNELLPARVLKLSDIVLSGEYMVCTDGVYPENKPFNFISTESR